ERAVLCCTSPAFRAQRSTCPSAAPRCTSLRRRQGPARVTPEARIRARDRVATKRYPGLQPTAASLRSPRDSSEPGAPVSSPEDYCLCTRGRLSLLHLSTPSFREPRLSSRTRLFLLQLHNQGLAAHWAPH
ncbi:hypothetical protein NDU88_002216, partial [Pleurodeles waltl]